MIVRALSGSVYVAIILLGCLAHTFSPTILAALLGVIALYEWQSIKENNYSLKLYAITIVIFIGVLLTSSPRISLEGFNSAMVLSAIVIAIMLFLFASSFSRKKGGIAQLSHNSFGLLYILIPLGLTPYLPVVFGNSNEPWLLASIFILIWCSDTFAYLVGRMFGRTKLFERVSPNKTWEGFIGGLIFTLLGAFVLFKVFGILTMNQWLGLGLIISVCGTLGDLFESAVKRNFGVKDSGSFIPGHGGILDRIDSFLIALPIAYFYLYMLQTHS